MIFEFTDSAREVALDKVNPDTPTMGLISLQQLQAHAALLGLAESTVEECEGDDDSFRGALDLYGTYCFGILNLLNFGDIPGERDRIGFYLKKNLFLLVDVCDSDQSTQAAFLFAVERAKTGNMCMEKLVYLMFERLLYGDGKALEKMGYDIDAMEQNLSGHIAAGQFNQALLRKKKELLLLRNYYEQMIDIGEELQENDGDFFATENLRYFKLFTDKVTRLADNVQMLRESLVQLHETYDAAVNLSLNNIMKALTVITVMFSPLMLIAGWYGMNFTNIPLIGWRYGYLAVACVSVLVAGTCLWFIKRNKML